MVTPTTQRQLWLAFTLSALVYLLAGTVSTLMATYLPAALPELATGTFSEQVKSQIGAYISAAFLYGWVIGGLFFGFLTDRIGRVKGLTLSAALYGVATVLTVFVPDWQLLILYRFTAGMGVGGVLLIATVYISEIWPLATRPIMLGVLAVSFPVGIVGSGALTVFFTNWRQAFLLGFIPLVLALAIFLFLDESLAWSSSQKGKKRFGQSMWAVDNRANLITGALIFGSVLIGLWGLFSWLPTWVQGLLPPGQSGQTERGLCMILLGMGGILGGIISGFLIKVLGSRTTLIITFSGCLFACSLLLLTNKQFSPIIYLEIALLSLFFGISQGALSSIIPELFPVTFRASATGVCFNIGRFFTATAVFFTSTLITFLGGLSNTLQAFSVAFLVALIAVLIRHKPKIS